MSADEQAIWERAAELARGQLGRTAPNPAVGCVIVSPDGEIVGEGATGDGGRPHAEEIALAIAGARARDAAAYVTLEPCAQRSGGAASCSALLAQAGVARVIYACADPHPNAAGRGVAHLRAQGVEVVLTDALPEIAAINAGFISLVERGRPLVAIDAEPASYDAELVPGEVNENDLTASLRALGARGVTRVCVAPGSALARALDAAGLVDIDATQTE